MWKATILTVLSACLIAACGHAYADTCDDLLPNDGRNTSSIRSITADDLLRLRDVGSSSTSDLTAPILAVSPNGRRVAFQVRRALPDSNTYCLGMVVADIDGKRKAILIDRGGEFMRISQSLLGVTDYQSGYTAVVTPKWSPDGHWVAFLKRTNGLTQVWRALSDGSHSEQVTRIDFDVEAFAWADDGKTIVFSGRPGLAVAEHTLEVEGQGGFLYDARFIPFAGNRPFPRDEVATESFVVSPEDKVSAKATTAEAQSLTPSQAPGAPPTAIRSVAANQGSLAWTELADPSNVLSKPVLHARGPDGIERTCATSACGDASVKVKDMWWLPSGQELIFLRESWNRSQASLYRWRPDTGEVHKLLVTEDVLLGCQLAVQHLVCAHEGSRQPRSLVSIDLETGKLETVVDLNPEFAAIKLGSVQRLTWTNAFGVSDFGDLVIPPDAKPGEQFPLIVVQYETRGFLRGGTDDEYPIFLFAAHRIAVLSFQHPDGVYPESGAKDWTEVNRLNYADWTNRRNIQASVEAGIKAAAATGHVDTSRLGVTGLSEGASMVQWAILNSSLFKAAASSSCCEDVVTTISLSGPAGADALYSVGYPRLTDNDQTFWRPYSFLKNASRMNTPLLLQSADNEYLTGSESVTALQELGKPVELYIFPNEFHVKWQPLHRLAVYTRNVDWFDFWLRDVEDTVPAKRRQYERWRTLREHMAQSSSTGPHQ
jgi:dipeptidyl aminopeptidase/acylaminoacyl peptidase